MHGYREAEANKIAEDLAGKGAPSMGLGQNSHTAKLIAGIADKVRCVRYESDISKHA